MNTYPDVLVRQSCDTGEGPLWHPDEQRIYWLDIPNSLLFRHRPKTGETETFDTGVPVGGMTLQSDGSLALFMAEGAVRIWQDGAFVRTILEEIVEERGNRFNDVIADPEGRVFCGVMSTEARAGRLYRLDPNGDLTVMLEGTGTANGMGFSPDLTQMYFCDSRLRTLSVFDYERTTGALSNRRILLTPEGDEGKPDGMTVDAEGCLWSARWDGARLVQLDSLGHELLRIDFPVRNVSCVTFGGADYKDMFITTARAGDAEKNGTLSGSLFHLNLGVQGRPEFRSAL
ncbi:MAG: SMP-30/gluconolactonase/LRE family protein [Lentisphaerae bacterium]|nr:SMP-30/gluconolactonase/LRE family protein [Lentisphaerota bacterium]